MSTVTNNSPSSPSSLNPPEKSSDDENPCTICQEDLDTDKQIQIACKHIFHKECLEDWKRYDKVSERFYTCPLCRHEYLAKASEPGLLEAIFSLFAMIINPCLTPPEMGHED
jgi:hypothetical protein